MIGSELYRDMEGVETPVRRAFKPMKVTTWRTPPEHRRAAVRLYERGITSADVGYIYDVDPKTISRWRSEYYN